jgi:hypothetical protein
VSRATSYTPRYAVIDYLRSLGARDDEMEAVSDDAVAWRGALYSAMVSAESPVGSPQSTLPAGA